MQHQQNFVSKRIVEYQHQAHRRKNFRIVTMWAAAKSTIETFVTAVARTLTELATLPVDTKGISTSYFLRARDDNSPHIVVSISSIPEICGVICEADSMTGAVIRAGGASATFTSKSSKALAFTSRAVAQTTTTTFPVNVLIVKCALLYSSRCLKVRVFNDIGIWSGVGRSVKPVTG